MLRLVEITPEMAAAVLAVSHLKRSKTNQREVDIYADQIRAGTWEPMLQDRSIHITPSGQLGDGYHRMNAIVQCGVPVKMVVEDYRPKGQRWQGETVEHHEFYEPGKVLIPSAKSPSKGGAGVGGKKTRTPTCRLCGWPAESDAEVESHMHRVHKEWL